MIVIITAFDSFFRYFPIRWGKANDLLIELGVKKTDLPDIVRGANIALR